jgi:hypothetical protein
MKIDPAMCMKTKATVTKCLVKNTTFTRKCTYCTIIDNHRREFLAKIHSLRANRGEMAPLKPTTNSPRDTLPRFGYRQCQVGR